MKFFLKHFIFGKSDKTKSPGNTNDTMTKYESIKTKSIEASGNPENPINTMYHDIDDMCIEKGCIYRATPKLLQLHYNLCHTKSITIDDIYADLPSSLPNENNDNIIDRKHAKNKIKKEIPDENRNNKRAKIKHYEKWIEKVGNQFYSLKEETVEIIEELKKENQTLKIRELKQKKILAKSEEELKWKNDTLEERHTGRSFQSV